MVCHAVTVSNEYSVVFQRISGFPPLCGGAATPAGGKKIPVLSAIGGT
jgi:hypothetical protein